MIYITKYLARLSDGTNWKKKEFHETLEAAVKKFKANIYHLLRGGGGSSGLIALKQNQNNIIHLGELIWSECENQSWSGLHSYGSLDEHDLNSQTKLRALLQNLLDEEHELRERPFRESTNPF